tara:strand:+ start:14 stop:418 length:405 start_codon:yes stop_codon:yes gene_type:complete
MAQFTTEDRWELLALHRTIMEAKFHRDPWDFDVGPSPILARIADRVVGALVEAEVASGKADAEEAWTRWRDATQHPRCVDAVRGMIERSSIWGGLTPSEKRDFVVDAFRPLVAPEAMIEGLVNGEGGADDGPSN